MVAFPLSRFSNHHYHSHHHNQPSINLEYRAKHFHWEFAKLSSSTSLTQVGLILQLFNKQKNKFFNFLIITIKGNVQKKTGKKRSGWPLGLTPPAPMKRSGKCEICWLWLLTLVYDYIWLKTNFTQHKKIDHQKFILEAPGDTPWYPWF